MHAQPDRRPFTVLHIEDDDNDAVLLATALQSDNPRIEIRGVPSAEAALSYLQGKNPYQDRESYPLPEMIILDLDLPGMTGADFLQWKAQSHFASIPVVVFTGFTDAGHCDGALLNGAQLVYAKGCTFLSFAEFSAVIWKLCAPDPEKKISLLKQANARMGDQPCPFPA